MKYFISLLVLGLISLQDFYGQSSDTLMMMSGRKIPVTIDKVDDFLIHFHHIKKNDRLIQGIFEKPEVFSMVRNGEKTIIYEPDPELGYEMSVEDQERYIYGLIDAQNGFETKWASIGSFVASTGGTVWMGSSFKPLAIPLLLPLGLQLPTIKAKPETISHQEYKTFEVYRKGYEKKARTKKFISTFLSSLGGVAAGLIINEAID